MGSAWPRIVRTREPSSSDPATPQPEPPPRDAPSHRDTLPRADPRPDDPREAKPAPTSAGKLSTLQSVVGIARSQGAMIGRAVQYLMMAQLALARGDDLGAALIANSGMASVAQPDRHDDKPAAPLQHRAIRFATKPTPLGSALDASG